METIESGNKNQVYETLTDKENNTIREVNELSNDYFGIFLSLTNYISNRRTMKKAMF